MRKCSSNAGGNTDGAKKIWSSIGDVWTYCRTFVCRFIYILHKIEWKWNTLICVKTPELSTSFSYFYNFILCCVHQLCSILFYIFVYLYTFFEGKSLYKDHTMNLVRVVQYWHNSTWKMSTFVWYSGFPRYTNEYTLFKFLIYDLNHLYIKYIYVINYSVYQLLVQMLCYKTWKQTS